MVGSTGIAPIDALRLREVAIAFQYGVVRFAEDSPLYAALCDAAQHDHEIVALAALTRPRSPPHFHLLCAVHTLLLGQPDDPLGQYFATITTDSKHHSGAYGPFRDFCLRNAGAIGHLLQHRTIQTSSTRRAAYILPLLGQIAAEHSAPLNLIEIGCSAGLLLAFDRYRIDFGTHGVFGDHRSRVVVTSEMRGSTPPAFQTPRIGRRVGMDLAPIRNPGAEEIRWMTGMLFPEWHEQARALPGALQLVSDVGVEFCEGDALANIAAVLDQMSDPICIFHSACLFYWPQVARDALDAVLTAASVDRVIVRIGVEPPPAYAERAINHASGGPVDHAPSYPQAIQTTYRSGAVEQKLLAHCGNFGEWIDWV